MSIALLTAAALQAAAVSPAKDRKPNVLFIFVDDLRRELGVYDCQVKTPNIDALAADGSTFYRQYISCPTSGASRYGLLTGCYPQVPAQLSNEACRDFISGREEGEDPETLFHQLRRNGYRTVGIGKISHYVDGRVYGYNDPVSDRLELPHSWDEMLSDPGKWRTGWNAFFGYSDGENRQSMKANVKPYECADVDDEGLPDGLTAALAVRKLHELAGRDEPFCLAVGFYKPHLPFVAPKKYWDMYDESLIRISPEPDLPEGSDPVIVHNSAEFNGYRAGEEHPSVTRRVSNEYARKLRHAYFAAVSYSDAQVGRVIDALKREGLYDDTIIIVWGDHGWHLGDQRVWGKHTVLETATASALVMKAPGCRKGIRNYRVVSSIDIYPTLMDLCHVSTPSTVQGHSFARLLRHPRDRRWKDLAYSYYKGCYTLRTPKYRISRYQKKGQEIQEIYGYGDDLIEHRNLAPSRPDLVKKLSPLLDRGITPAVSR